MYGYLLRSLVAWYGRNGRINLYTYMMAATAMAFCLFLNLLAIAILVSLVSPMNLMKSPIVAWVPLPLAALLWIGNAILASNEFRRVRNEPAGGCGLKQSSRIALAYLIGSLSSLVLFAIFLINIKG